MKMDNKLPVFGILIIISLLLQIDGKRHNPFAKECQGSSLGPSYTERGNSSQYTRYQSYVSQYSNCTVITTNLEIVQLKLDDAAVNETYDMSFLESIEEVYGYVLIAYNHVEAIPLTNLRVIHGRFLYSSGYSLFISHNFKINSSEVGLKELRLNSLQEIIRGNVSIVGNNLLCHVNTIHWNDILSDPEAIVERNKMDNGYQRICGAELCHDSCYQNVTGSTHCWASGSDNCQQFRRLVCSENCEGNCFGPDPRQCCSPQCAGGCMGSKTQCWTCRNFNDGDECVEHCPRDKIYNIITSNWDPNPNMKYAYKNMCLDKCPNNMYVMNGACVTSCGEGYKPSVPGGNECVPCGEACPKNCTGGNVSSKTIQNFVNCTIIEGSLKLLNHAWTGHPGLAPLDVSDLHVLETVEEITDCLQVEMSPASLQSLSFLKNLKKIRGHKSCSDDQRTVKILMTKLKTLGLSSLESVASGTVLIMGNNELEELDLVSLKSISQSIMIFNNPRLCYYKSLNWTHLTGAVRDRGNAKEEYCEQENKTCSDECSDGCWGAGDEMCVDCARYRYERQCVAACEGLLYAENNETKLCKRCHSECADSCTGESASDCLNCRHVRDGPYCRAECPSVKYPDSQRRCQLCSASCKDQQCSGPSNLLGPGGCNACEKYIENSDGQHECIAASTSCPEQHYEGPMPVPTAAKNYEGKKGSVLACRRCHKECSKCLGSGSGSECLECKRYRQAGQCVSGCSLDHYLDPTHKLCLPCDRRCLRCQGSTNENCLTCRYYKLYASDVPDGFNMASYDQTNADNAGVEWANNTSSSNVSSKATSNSTFSNNTLDEQFYCIEECLTFATKKIKETKNNITESVCTNQSIFSPSLPGPVTQNDVYIAVGAVIGMVGLLVFAGFFINRTRLRRKKERERITAELLGLRTLEASSPSAHKPDLSNLRVISEAELTRGKTIGSGAFGTVYQGIWTPHGEKIKIAVAIKVLQKGANTSEMNTELLEEARIMATVRHENCIRILAVSLTAELMLITQLMPNGSLLDYVRKYRERIGSNALLTWSKQIAQGMQYLEELGIVHRDLAARNVLVEGPQTVKITDFGLAKLVYNKEYLAEGGKVPIKWLALESIQHRVFTHMSDVWSYGVTLWEVYTYGKRPYDNVSAKDLCDLLENGERLYQPQICTIDVYMIMIKCWMVDAQSRPSFAELVDTFTNFAKDPGRYLVIQEDDRMQLPTPDQSLREMLKSLSLLEEDRDKVVSAEEYLRPHDLILDHLAMMGCGEVNYTNFSNEPSSPLVSPVNCKTQDSRFDSLPRAQGEIGRKHSQRYYPEPCNNHKLTKMNSYTSPGEMESLRRPQQPLEHAKAKVTDDEDYLRPLSSANKRPTYIEVLRQSNPDLEDDYVDEQTDYVNSQIDNSNSKENPVYFQNSVKPFQQLV